MEAYNILYQSFLNAIDQKFVLITLIFFIVLVFISLFLKLKNNNLGLRYRSKENLFSKAEKSFFLVLKQSLADNYEIFSKVRIADVLMPDKGLSRKNWGMAFSRISSKHFDYVLCDKNTLAIVAVIELDDKSHNQKKVIKRDAFVNKACQSANVKLLRFPCKSNYQIQSIRDTVNNSLNN